MKASTKCKTPRHKRHVNHPDSTSKRSSSEGYASGSGALSVVILFHLVAIASWTIPLDWPPITQIRQLARPYLLWTGLEQSWDMFSPNPADANSTLKAVVITQRRHVHVWMFPHDETLTWRKRFLLDRYRAFQETIARPKSAPLLPEVALHIARSFNNLSDPPDSVMIIEFRHDISPGEDESLPPAAKTQVLYDDYVDTEALK